ncbi:Disintegrin [Teladorsagia circumcincta]|uniref:Disintegrin n=1 Tax=Teladorsagia circumcincta TaxID=45464 RepID=A0A2G9UU05_TELCI|nr:Disintegrin [Teladorsagia circumcincta]
MEFALENEELPLNMRRGSGDKRGESRRDDSQKQRSFHLSLLPLDPYNDHFHPDHILDEDGRYEDIEPHKFLYEGFVKDDPGSKVYGSILDGVFEGHIRTGDGNSYSVDRAAKYFDHGSRPSQYHSIVYRDGDINHNKIRVKRSASSPESSDIGLHSCGLDDRVKRDMERIQRSAEVPSDVHGRSKRATRDSSGLYTVRTCSLYLQADHKLYEHIKRKEGNNDPIRTREEIVSLFYNHIKAVNEIYEGTNFNGIKGLHFVIQRTSSEHQHSAEIRSTSLVRSVTVDFLKLTVTRWATNVARLMNQRETNGAKCSPSEGYCCNSETCSLHQALDYKICRQESECSETQWCNGLTAQCPPSPPKEDGLPCQDSTKVCSRGSCNGSICEFVGLKDCFLTEGKPEELCFLACIKDGSYCDIFRKCRSVDANGPLARLKNLLFNKKTIETRQRRQRSRAPLPGATPSSGAPRSSAPAQQSAPSGRPRASAPPLPQGPPVAVPVIPSGSAPPVSTVLVVEPPPPYTAAADPGSALGGPRRGHRRNKRQTSSDVVPKAPKSRTKGK